MNWVGYFIFLLKSNNFIKIQVRTGLWDRAIKDRTSWDSLSKNGWTWGRSRWDRSSQDRTSWDRSSKDKNKLVKSVQVKMVKFYLGLECGPTQSYLFIYKIFNDQRLLILFKVWPKYFWCVRIGSYVTSLPYTFACIFNVLCFIIFLKERFKKKY